MCGIYGMVSPAGAPLRHPELLDRMRRDLAHRGPDAHGAVTRPHAALGVARLRVVDLSLAADQPLTDSCGRVWLALNGEIYNAGALRARYPDYPWRSRSDSEVVLPLYLERGQAGLEELDGMFALALWDERTRALVLARDRAGEKPLFVARRNGETWFASEPQALLHGSGRVLDRLAFAHSVRWGWIPEPRTPFVGVSRVEAGTIMRVDAGGARVTRYWNPGDWSETAEAGSGKGEWGTGKGGRAKAAGDLAVRLEALLQNAVRKQLVSDVPVGVFTSGGLDSSLLVALAAAEMGGDRLHTFTVRFPDPSYDEGPPARAVARRFGTCHVEVMATPPDLAAAWDTVVEHLAEPVSDPALLPTWLLARAARERVGVVLSGEGADELFGGYPTYAGHRLAGGYAALPGPLRAAARAVTASLPESAGKVTVEFLLRRFVTAAELPWWERHRAWVGTGLGAEILAPDLADTPEPVTGAAGVAETMLFDYQNYLRDNLLVKVDRATMLAALEARAPFLDQDVTRFALGLPAHQRLRGLRSKWLLRRVARRRLPPGVTHRRKRGLSVPLAGWLTGAVASEVDRLLGATRLARQGLLNHSAVRQLVTAHRRGRFAASRGLWTLLVWQRWLDHWIPEGMA